jgi:hypothetical protein
VGIRSLFIFQWIQLLGKVTHGYFEGKKKKKTHGYLEMNGQDSIKKSIKCHCFCRMIRGRKKVKEYSFNSLTSSSSYLQAAVLEARQLVQPCNC